jgi:iron complex transport system ATP-binding protein
MSRIDCSTLVVRRGGRTILDGIDLRAEAGEFVAVIGANGAGKTTLLSALAGLLVPGSGAILLDGRNTADWNRAQLARARAFLPQDPRCEWPIPVERLVALGLTPVLPAFGGLPRALASRVDAVLETCDLVSLRRQPATTLSSGEFARAMLARALVSDPDVLIADEPVAGLDPRHALDTMARLRELARAGRLVIASVHDLTLAARVATRIVALASGRVAADGAPAAVLDSALIRRVFDVEAQVSRTPAGLFVDYGAGEPASSTNKDGVLEFAKRTHS